MMVRHGDGFILLKIFLLNYVQVYYILVVNKGTEIYYIVNVILDVNNDTNTRQIPSICREYHNFLLICALKVVGYSCSILIRRKKLT